MTSAFEPFDFQLESIARLAGHESLWFGAR